MKRTFSSVAGWQALKIATPKTVANDVIAGLVLTALLIPAGMGYAQASGLAPVTGLYATIVPLVVYAMVGPSRILVLGPDSSLTALIAAVVIPLSRGDAGRAIAIASALAVVSGVFCLVAAAARLGFLVDLLSLPVRQGYLSGIAIVVIVAQLPRLCGFSTNADGVLEGVSQFARGIADGKGNVTVSALAGSSLAIIALIRHWKPKFPTGLLAVVMSIVAVTVFDLRGRGVPVVGALSGGLPRPSLPRIDRRDWGTLIVSGLSIAMVAFADSSVLSRTYAARGQYDVDSNHELAAIGAANMASGFFGGFSVSASASRTPAAEAAGARSQITGIVSALTICALLLWAPNLLRNLPLGVLAAVVVASVVQLFQAGSALRLYRARRSEFGLMAVAFFGVVTTGAIRGVGIAIGISILNFLRKAWRPHVTQLVRVDGLKGYHDADRHPDGRRVPGLLLFRFDAPLFFANAEVFREQVLHMVAEHGERGREPVHRVVVTAEPITDIDATAAAMLEDLHRDLNERQVTLAFAELKGHVRDRIVPFGLVELIGREHFHATVGEAVKAYVSDEEITWVDWQDTRSVP